MNPRKHAHLGVLGVALTLALIVLAARPMESTQAAGVPWSDSLAEYGMPASAYNTWQPSNWDVMIHTRDMENAGDTIDTHDADHGSDCSAPPATHSINTWQNAVFVCHSHVMTAIADSGYGEATLTPDRMADWSGGPVTLGFSVSTQITTSRDWISIDLSPFAEQLAFPFDLGEVDGQGMPLHYIELRSDLTPSNDIKWQIVREQNGNDFGTLEQESAGEGIPPSAVVRTPFELVISSTGYLFRVAASSASNPGEVLLQGNWTAPLPFTRAVVQFAHHSYNPEKCDVTARVCAPNTWHWSDFSLTNAVQYTLLRPTDHQVVSEPSGSTHFASGAPSGAFLKFVGIGAIQVSYDNGATYHTAAKSVSQGEAFHEEHFSSYFDPVPAGATSALFQVAGGWWGAGQARDFSLVSETLGGPQPTPTSTTVPPTPTATSPLPTPTPVPPTPTPVPPTPTPTPSTCTQAFVAENGVILPNPAKVNVPATIGYKFTMKCSGTVIVQYLVLDGASGAVRATVNRTVTVTGGQIKTDSFSWTGTYTGSRLLKVGVFSTNWSTTYHWNDNAGTFNVVAA